MLFRQRLKPQALQKLRTIMWPRRSWLRSMEYLKKRMVRLSASPHAVALGFAFGVFASCTPFVGLHFLMAAALAFIFGGNLISSAIGTAFGNPLTFPLIWATTFNIGNHVLPHAQVAFRPARLSYEFFMQSLDSMMPIFARMLVGSIPLGLLSGAICYFVVRSLVGAYQLARRRRFAQRDHRALEHRAVVDGMRDPV